MPPTSTPPGRALSRRGLLAGAGAAAGLVVVSRMPAAGAAPGAGRLRSDPFTLGVASGDPLPDGVVLWTRLAPDPLAGGGMPDRPVPVQWQVATDERFRDVVRDGTTMARPRLGHSVHVEVSGLRPERWYWYRFRVGQHLSPVGRTRTAPGRGSSPEALAFAFVSCQDYQNGYYTAYQDLVAQDLDLVVHLGDSIYEYGPEAKTRPGSPPARVHDGPEVFSLESYRNRHALYRSDLDLQAAHAHAPWIVTWDDHEVENNYAGLIPEETTSPPGDFGVRRANAYQAYYENMPLRAASVPTAEGLQLYRRLHFGDLASFHVLDTRQHRTDQPCGDGLKNCADRFDPAATMTGDAQEAWLLRGLDRSRSVWDVVAQQTIFAEVDFNPLPGSAGPAGLFNVDQWDGYVAQRRRITELLAGPGGPANPVVITGDIHSSWVTDIKVDYDDPASPVVATEFVGTSITSDFPLVFIAPVLAALPDNPHIKDFDGLQRGYVVCRLDRQRWLSEYRVVATIDQPTSPASVRRRWVVEQAPRAPSWPRHDADGAQPADRVTATDAAQQAPRRGRGRPPVGLAPAPGHLSSSSTWPRAAPSRRRGQTGSSLPVRGAAGWAWWELW